MLFRTLVLLALSASPALAQNSQVSDETPSCGRKVLQAAVELTTDTFNLTVAKVNTCRSTPRVKKVLFRKSYTVLLGTYLTDARISDEGIQLIRSTMKKLVEDALEQKATEIIGVASRVFHNAKNGNEIISSLNVDAATAEAQQSIPVTLKVINTEEESILQYYAVKYTLKNPRRLVVVDMRDDQLILVGTDPYSEHEDPLVFTSANFGFEGIRKKVFEAKEKQIFSDLQADLKPSEDSSTLNPINHHIWLKVHNALRREFGKQLRNYSTAFSKIFGTTRQTIVGYGTAFLKMGESLPRQKSNEFSESELAAGVKNLIGKTDQEIVAENTSRPNPIMIQYPDQLMSSLMVVSSLGTVLNEHHRGGGMHVTPSVRSNNRKSIPGTFTGFDLTLGVLSQPSP